MVTGAGGLTASEVAQRVANGQTNATEQHTSRSVKEIIRANVLTRFNAILGVLALAVAVTGRWADGLFAVVLVANALIGIVQEVRAKRTLDRLVVLNAPNATVIRDGTVEEIQIGEIVLADLVELRSGDQVPADGEVLDSDGLEVNESALTGESDAVHKKPGDRLLSGTIVVAGSGQFVTDAVGNDAYAHKLAAEVKVFSRTTSEIQASIDTLLRYLTWVILAVSPLLLWSQFHTNEADDWREPVVGSVAALVGMIPEGLVLLTSVAFLLAALTLAKRNVLVQELPAVEVLARVDVVCLDKTGTLTVGDIAFEELHVLGPTESIDVEAALAALAHHQEPNASLLAIMAQYPKPVGWSAAFEVPFSSSRKWSGVTFTDRGTFVLGAPEMVLDETDPARALVAELASKGRRVMALIHSPNPLVDDQLPAQHRAVGVVALAETIRPDARETLEYFGSQGVDIKIISGDNPSTVGAI
ncbi:MAG: HAD-IC family P-type ATPase, partial [Acidimicrobiales bacterium]|nr:HAD-IC family P-type ATPase [Acidimicrobiales bacterium]